MDTPSYANTQVKVDAPPVDPVNAGLNAGKSWEQIARETGADQTEIANYSRATRPNYGVAQIEKPKQSNWNKFRDVLEANTEADKWRRQEANKTKMPDEQVPITAENPGNIIGNTIGAIPRTFNTIGTQGAQVIATTQAMLSTAEAGAAQKALQEAKATKDPRIIAAAQARLDQALLRQQNDNYKVEAANDSFDTTSGGLFNVGTIYGSKDAREGGMHGVKNIVTNTGEGMIDVATLGLGSVTGKQIVKVGVKQAVKESAPVLVKTAALNTLQGGLGAARQDATLPQVLESAAIAGTAGTVGDVALGGTGAVIIKSKNGIVSKLSTPNVKVNAPDVSVPTPTVKVAPEAPSVFQAVNPTTGEKIYKVIDPQDFETAKAKIDGGEGGIAGTRRPDGFVPHITAKTPAQMEALGFTNAGKYTTGVDDVITPTPKIEVGKTQSLADLLPNIGDRKALLPQVTSKIDDMKRLITTLSLMLLIV